MIKSNLRKPLRFVGQAMVIVISILLAFAIDAAWAQRQLRGQEKLALASLEEEFTANLQQVQLVIEIHKDALELVRMLVEAPQDSLLTLSQVDRSKMMLATGILAPFDPVLGTTAALVGTGQLGVLQNSRLREAITTFDNYVLDAEDDADLMFLLAPDVWKAQIPLGGPWYDPVTEVGTAGAVQGLDFLPAATAQDLLRVRADRDLIGLIGLHHLNAGYYVVELERIRDHITLVLQLISEARGLQKRASAGAE